MAYSICLDPTTDQIFESVKLPSLSKIGFDAPMSSSVSKQTPLPMINLLIIIHHSHLSYRFHKIISTESNKKGKGWLHSPRGSRIISDVSAIARITDPYLDKACQQNDGTGGMNAHGSSIKPKAGWCTIFDDATVQVFEVGKVQFSRVAYLGVQKDVQFGI